MYKQSKNEEFYMGDEALVFYTDEMLEMCNVPIRISCQTNDLFSPIKFEITMNLKQ
jgi:hypothetical protein